MIFGLLATPVNILLFQVVGNAEASGLIPNLLATGAVALVSAGIGWIKDLNRIDDILHDADMAKYHAKASGGNCFKLFDVGMRAQAETSLFKAP